MARRVGGKVGTVVARLSASNVAASAMGDGVTAVLLLVQQATRQNRAREKVRKYFIS